MTVLQTPRLRLRHARPDDLIPLHAVLSDARATRWWSTPPHESLDQTREWLDAMIAGNAAGTDDFIVERDGVVIGKAGFWRLPDVGYILHPDHWASGWRAKPSGRRWITCFQPGLSRP